MVLAKFRDVVKSQKSQSTNIHIMGVVSAAATITNICFAAYPKGKNNLLSDEQNFTGESLAFRNAIAA